MSILKNKRIKKRRVENKIRENKKKEMQEKMIEQYNNRLSKIRLNQAMMKPYERKKNTGVIEEINKKRNIGYALRK